MASAYALFFVDTSNDADRIKANVKERNRHEETFTAFFFNFISVQSIRYVHVIYK